MDESLQEHLKQNETADILRRAKALIPDQEHWWQEGLSSFLPGGGRTYCAGLAISHSSDAHWQASYVFSKAIGGNGLSSIYDWNDAPGRTHAEVMQAFDRAIALAEREGR